MSDSNNNAVATKQSAVTDARTPSGLSRISIDTIVATAILCPHVWPKLAAVVRSERFVANPFHRQIIKFVHGFLERYGKHPESGDFTVWLGHLPEGFQQDAITEALQRLFVLPLPPTPEFLGDVVQDELRHMAAQLIVSNLATTKRVSTGDIREQLDEIDELLQDKPQQAGRRWPTLGQLMTGAYVVPKGEEDADLMIIPRVAARGRHIIIAGLPKIGKSTLLAHAVGALTRGAEFFDGRAVYGRALWLGLDESSGDAYPRLAIDARARRDRFRVVDPPDPLAFLRSELDKVSPDETLLVVIDSLIEYARRIGREVPASGEAAGWAKVVRPLTKMAHDHGVAFITVHHSRRLDEQYRDSGEIVAGVDAIITMMSPLPSQADNVRRIEMKGRRSITRRTSKWTARLVTYNEEVPVPPEPDVIPLASKATMVPRTATVKREVYEFAGQGEEERKIDPHEQYYAPVYQHVAAQPGCAVNSLAKAIGLGSGKTNSVLDTMERRGYIRVERFGQGRSAKVWPVQAPEPSDSDENVENRLEQ